MTLLSRAEAERFAEDLILAKAKAFFEELDENIAIEEHSVEHDVIIDDEDVDLIKDLVNTGRVMLLPWGEG